VNKRKKRIKIGNRYVGDEEPCFIIAEIGSNHDGRLDQAKRLIDIAVEAGADAVKFQSFRASAMFNRYKNKDIVEKLEGLELHEDWYREIFDYTSEKSIMALFSVFDERSVDFLDDYDVDAFKIASYELTHTPLLEYVAKKNKPVIISTGMATESEVMDAVKSIYSMGNKQVIILHCVSQYPTNPRDVNLNSMVNLKKIFDCPVGFSDHTQTIYAPIAAAALGADMIEKHFTLDKSLPGTDHSYALNPKELLEMTKGIRYAERMLGDSIVKPTKSEEGEREWRRAIYASCNISNGTVINSDMLMILRPSPKGYISPKYFDQVIGKRIKKDIKKGELISKEFVEISHLV